MRWTRIAVLLALGLGATLLFILSFAPFAGGAANPAVPDRGDGDADLPPRLNVEVDKRDYLSRRAEAIALRRGLLDDPSGRMRARAVEMLTGQETQARRSSAPGSISDSWIPLGPGPIPNGSGQGGTTPTSGRVISIAVDPADPNIAYVGTAQAGLYRTKDGGATWTRLLDNGLTLAVGSLMLVPGDRTTLWVGTGECGFAGDNYFGYGLYRIKTADTTPVVEGPFNKDAATGLKDLITGRSVAGIAVDPNNPDVLYIATGSGIGGRGSDSFGNAPARGLFKSSNATTANPTFTKLAIGPIAATTDQRVLDILFEPGSSTNMVVSVVTLSGTLGGVWRTTNANSATPTFTQTLSITDIPPTSGLTRCELAQTKVGGVTTIYAASSENSGAATCGTNGTLRKSMDGGATWTAPIAGGNGFCGTQCFYNIALDVNPNDPTNVLLGGNTNGACTKAIARSTNSGASFLNSPNVHADNHVVKFAPSNPLIVYEGNDGGIFKSTNGGVTFVSINTAGFIATQFESIALHPTDRQFMIGGTQDNGTEYLNSNGVWANGDGGDGGFALVDQSNGSNLENVNMYHTYFNSQDQLVGFARMTKASCLATRDWVFRGACGSGGDDPTMACDSTAEVLANGMSCSDAVEFYAPMALGPGTPNTVYYGTTRLYRSANRGDIMPAVSQTFPSTITSIGVSPQDDNVRLVGTRTGGLFLTTTGAASLTNVTGAVPAKYIARTIVDPNSATTAYVALAGFGTTASPIQHVWKTTGLSEGGTTWTAASNGLPDIPVNAFAVDVNDPVHQGITVLYAGTDIGVYTSIDSGANWVPYGTGLPRVAIFDMAIQSPNRVLRIASHGRGIWEIGLPGTTLPGPTPTASPSATATATAIPTATSTATPTPTATATATPTSTATATATVAPTATATATATATSTPTPTATPTFTPTATATATATPTATATATATPTITPAAQALNLSTRMRTDTGDNAGIGGFIITGSVPKHVIIRALGLSLASFGFPTSELLSDPTLELHGPNGFPVISNNDWKDSQQTQIQNSGLAPTNQLESAIDAALEPGQYTAIVRGNGTGVGICTVEVFDLDTAAASKLANLSTRAFVRTGNSVVIAGFILGNNSGNDRIVVRGLGPSLGAFGISNALQDPKLELRDANGALLKSNDDWTDDSVQAAELVSAGLAPANPKESGIAAVLFPGAYTAILAGESGGEGVGTVEVYDRGQ